MKNSQLLFFRVEILLLLLLIPCLSSAYPFRWDWYPSYDGMRGITIGGTTVYLIEKPQLLYVEGSKMTGFRYNVEEVRNSESWKKWLKAFETAPNRYCLYKKFDSNTKNYENGIVKGICEYFSSDEEYISVGVNLIYGEVYTLSETDDGNWFRNQYNNILFVNPKKIDDYRISDHLDYSLLKWLLKSNTVKFTEEEGDKIILRTLGNLEDADNINKLTQGFNIDLLCSELLVMFPNTVYKSVLGKIIKVSRERTTAGITQFINQELKEIREKLRHTYEDLDDNVERAVSKNCYKFGLLKEADIPTFKFSGQDYKPSANVYEYICTNKQVGRRRYMLYLQYDTKAPLFNITLNKNWEAGWYWYDNSMDKNGPYDSVEKAAEAACECK